MNSRRTAAARRTVSSPDGTVSSSRAKAANAQASGESGGGRRRNRTPTTTPTKARSVTATTTHSSHDTEGAIGGAGNSSMPVTGRADSGLASAIVDTTFTSKPPTGTSSPFTFTGAKITRTGSPGTNGDNRNVRVQRWRFLFPSLISVILASSGVSFTCQFASESGSSSGVESSTRRGGGPSIVSVACNDSESAMLLSLFDSRETEAVGGWANATVGMGRSSSKKPANPVI